MKEIQVKEKGVILHEKALGLPTALVLADDLAQDEWEKIGQGINKYNNASQWWIGDWANHGDTYYRRGLADDIAEKTGFAKKTVQEYKSIAKQVKSSIRMEDLDFGHYQLLAPMLEEEQEYWRDMAIELGWTVDQLRQALKREKLPSEGDLRLLVDDMLLSHTEKRGIIKKALREELSLEQSDMLARSVAQALDPRTRDRLAVMPFDKYEHDPDRIEARAKLYGDSDPIEEGTTVSAIAWADNNAVVQLNSGLNRNIEAAGKWADGIESDKFPEAGVPFTVQKIKEVISAWEKALEEIG